MQIAAGMQRHRGHPGGELQGRFGREHILLNMAHGQVMALAELLAGLDQSRVIFQARQLLPGA